MCKITLLIIHLIYDPIKINILNLATLTLLYVTSWIWTASQYLMRFIIFIVRLSLCLLLYRYLSIIFILLKIDCVLAAELFVTATAWMRWNYLYWSLSIVVSINLEQITARLSCFGRYRALKLRRRAQLLLNEWLAL